MILVAAFGVISLLWLLGMLVLMATILWHRCWSPKARGQVYYHRKQSVAWLTCIRERGILR